MKIKLSELFDPEIIDLNMNVRKKDEAIEYLTKLLFNAGYITDEVEYISDIYKREKLGITGMGNGIAIPHGKSNSVLKIGLAVGKTVNDIKWESYDDKPVNVIFLFAVPNKKEGNIIHLKLLSEVARRLGNEEVLSKVKNVTTINDIRDIMFS